jgi:hypothetical protein
MSQQRLEIRRAQIENGAADSIAAVPPNMFYTWLLGRR